jgi:hypothetical protein
LNRDISALKRRREHMDRFDFNMGEKNSIQNIIQVIRSVRNHFIDELMDEAALMEFIKEHFNTIAISAGKIDFVRKKLLELKTSPLDLVEYSSLIRLANETNIGVIENHPLLLKALKGEFIKLGF